MKLLELEWAKKGELVVQFGSIAEKCYIILKGRLLVALPRNEDEVLEESSIYLKVKPLYDDFVEAEFEEKEEGNYDLENPGERKVFKKGQGREVPIAEFIPNSLLDAINQVYEAMPQFSGVSIQGYLDIIKIVVILVGIILSISLITDKSPLVLLAGLGALMAVLLLIFRDTILAEALVRSHVDALKRKMPNPEAAILGCTHYPLMEDIFQDALGDHVKVYSQANIVAESLADYLERYPAMVGPGTESKFLTTGDPRKVSNQATQFLRRKIEFASA